MKKPDTLNPNGIQPIKILMLGISCVIVYAMISRLLCLVMHCILLRKIKVNTFHINILSILYDRTQNRIEK